MTSSDAMTEAGSLQVRSQVCSRAGCTQPARWNVNWRNPKIHTPDRVKVWLACDEHREFLFDYLATRSFPVVLTPLNEHVERVPEPRVPKTAADAQ